MNFLQAIAILMDCKSGIKCETYGSTWYLKLYCSDNSVFSGRDIWFSCLFHKYCGPNETYVEENIFVLRITAKKHKAW